MAEAVVGPVLENLISFAGTVGGLFLGFNQVKERLDSMLTAIKATLHDAEEKQFSSKAIKDWLGKLKHSASELEDILDECAYETLDYQEESNKVGNRFLLLMNSFYQKINPVFLYKITKKMKSISERFQEIYDERTQFLPDLTVQKITSGVPEWRQTMSFTIEPQVYGREEDTKRIVDSLIGYVDAFHSENLLVYPIVGQGGLGKTTLAQLIYKDERVVKHFEPRMWVCVSEDFSCRRMIKAIIKEASGKDCEDSDLEPLRKTLQDQLRSKRYLLVLDDVWDDKPDNWQTLRSVLDCGAKGAAILVTTRLSKVVEIMGAMKDVGELSKLSDNDCWELFKCKAFGPNEAEQVELVNIGKAIANKCGGVPLAAKALGAFLRFQRKEKGWLNVLESNIWRLEDNMMPALRLSYLNLPVKLRPCFAYCAIFPKDEKIRKQDLIELWMANGFISSEGRLDADDVGDNVWHELYWRSFFQDIERDEFGQVTRFKMHDLVHDLAQSIAEDVCCITTDNGVTTVPETIQHISDHRRRWPEPDELINSMHQVKYLRTYICQHDASTAQFPAHTLKRYPLRVLQRGGIKELSSSIGDLKHLRYLNLSHGGFETLPESLGKLWNLLILKLDSCGNLQKLPNSMVHLKALQQLSLNDCDSLSSLAPQIGKLSSLRIFLSKYIVGNERGFLLSELGPLKLKGDFYIEHLEKVKSVADAKEANMSIKQLNKLELSWERNEEWELQENVVEILEVLQPDTQHLKSLRVTGYKGVHLPQWMSISPSLESLTLRHLPNLIRLSREDGENMLPRLSSFHIEDCPKLEVLIKGMHSLKKLTIEGCDKLDVSAGFQCLTCLEELLIDECREVEGLDEALQHMTALKELSLRDIGNLESLPDGIGSLPLLKELRLNSLPNLESLPDGIGSLPLLKELRLNSLPNLESLPDCIGSLPLLKKLFLESLPNLESLPDCIGSLPLLEELYIERCEKLRCLPTSLSLLTSLKELWLESLPNLESLPDCIGSLPLLEYLSLESLPNLESLPDCIGSLPLLEKLTIRECEKLRCLPTSLSLLTSLRWLDIGGCHPELKKRCEKETGEDWPKIAHIPYIRIL